MTHPSRQSKRRTRRPAFSLIELVITMIIVATFAALAAPRYAHSLDRYRIDAGARHVMADLERAQAAARRSGQPVTVVFDVISDQYEAGDEPTVDVGSAPHRLDLVSATFADQGPSVTFDGYGVPDAAGTVVLGAGPQLRVITVNAGSGAVEMLEP